MSNLRTPFLTAERGNVGIIFALSMLPLMVATGAAIDYSRAGDTLSRLQAASDAAILHACQAPKTDAATTLRARAQTSIREFMGNDAATVTDFAVTNDPRTARITTSLSVPTVFMKVARRDEIAVGVNASCSANEKHFEIALVLDMTTSMRNTDAAGKTKMQSAKDAATAFVDYMFTTGAQPGHLKMSLVPFAASVALPTSLRSASWVDTGARSPVHFQYLSNNTGTGAFASRFAMFDRLKTARSDWAWKGCVESPPYPHNVTDGAVSTGNASSLFVPMLAPDEQPKTCSFFGYQYDCSNNSYIDDGTSTSTSSTCRSNDPSQMKRFTQACKYRTPTNTRTDQPGPNWHCTARPFSTLGTSQATLKTEIAALTPDGQTNIHEGLMWGWRTISPTSVFAGTTGAPVAYDTPGRSKVIVLMTDGMNTWNADSGAYQRSEYSAYGYFRDRDGNDATGANSRFKPTRNNMSSSADARAAIDELTLEGCSQAKTKRVTIYTIGFSTPGDPIDAAGLSLLQQCATTPNEHHFVANDSAGLISAFDKIAKGIGQLRLTQ